MAIAAVENKIPQGLLLRPILISGSLVRFAVEAYMQTFGPIPLPSEGCSIVVPAGKHVISRVAQLEMSWEEQPSSEFYGGDQPPALPPKRRERERPTGTSTPVPQLQQSLTIEEIASIPNTTQTPLNSPVSILRSVLRARSLARLKTNDNRLLLSIGNCH